MKINKPDIHNNIIDISSFQNGLNNLFLSNGLYLKSNVLGSHKGKNMFFQFLGTSSQNVHFCGCDIFSCLGIINELNFSVAVHVDKIHVLDEAFFLFTIKIPMITKLFRVVACCKELHSISTDCSYEITSPPVEDVSTSH